ncbi:MAG: hypothetical protein B6242_01210 [Anaerolineaceae bacterium 4572_78]|nr:MAG: hypothetical protein B6242_01210 [Anaerolineaceae bacterium 4572_78]
MKQKHVSQRMCIVCREVQAKHALIRIVKPKPLQFDSLIFIDEKGKALGRGAYLCKKASCWRKCLSKKFLNRALRTSVSDADVLFLKMYADTRFK